MKMSGNLVGQLPAMQHRVALHLHGDQDREPHHERRTRAGRAPYAAAELLAEQRRLHTQQCAISPLPSRSKIQTNSGASRKNPINNPGRPEGKMTIKFHVARGWAGEDRRAGRSRCRTIPTAAGHPEAGAARAALASGRHRFQRADARWRDQAGSRLATTAVRSDPGRPEAPALTLSTTPAAKIVRFQRRENLDP